MPWHTVSHERDTDAGLSLRGKKKERKRFVTPTETNVHGDALCFMVKTWATHKTTETVLNTGWRLAVGRWWRLAADGDWQLVVGGGWRRLAVGGWWSLGAALKAVLNKKGNGGSQGQRCMDDRRHSCAQVVPLSPAQPAVTVLQSCRIS